ncbi:MAG: hypothetical protein DRJ60_06700 [Thermoprotei archaeon]|nr:MAG: hypothetical protein DRJ60_06700 [Thermoprotei archaeon]
MKAEARILLATILLLFIIGIWDTIAIALYVGSQARLLAKGEGLDRLRVSFCPPENGTLLICYELSVEPNPLTIGDKHALLKIMLCDSAGKIIWAREAYKGVKAAVRVATDHVAIDADKIQGITPCRVYVIVDKVTWGRLKKLRVEIKHNPYVKPMVYSPITLMVEVFSACILPFIIALALPQTLIERCRGARAIFLVLIIAILYIAFRYVLYRILGILINPIDYMKILLSLLKIGMLTRPS